MNDTQLNHMVKDAMRPGFPDGMDGFALIEIERQLKCKTGQGGDLNHPPKSSAKKPSQSTSKSNTRSKTDRASGVF